MKKNNFFRLAQLFFSFVSFCLQGQTHFVVVVPSYNNEQWCKKNLDSIFSQEYDNYRVIYIDDCSTDANAQLVKRYIVDHNLSERVMFICNKQRRGALFNTWQAALQCDDHEVVMILDGDDWFACKDAMQIVDQEYQKGALITFGQFKRYPTGQKGYCRAFPRGIITHSAYREYDWLSGALRTFRADLFKSIALKDLLYKGDFFFAAGDLAYMFPMLEMAHGKISYIDDQIYIYNNATPNNDHKVRVLQQIHCDKVVRSREKYAPKRWIILDSGQSKVDIMIHASCPEQLTNCIASLKNFVSGYNRIHVLCSLDQDYSFIKKTYSNVIFHRYDTHFFSLFLNCLQSTVATYVLCLDDEYIFTDDVNCRTCVDWMQKTKAIAFCLEKVCYNKVLPIKIKGKKLLVTELLDSIIAWQLQDAFGRYRLVGQWNSTMYARESLIEKIKSVVFDSYKTLQQNILHVPFDPTDVILGYSRIDA